MRGQAALLQLGADIGADQQGREHAPGLLAQALDGAQTIFAGGQAVIADQQLRRRRCQAFQGLLQIGAGPDLATPAAQQTGQRLAPGFIVLQQQDPPAQRGAGRFGWLPRPHGGARQAQREAGALARAGVQLQRMLQQRGQLLDDGQTEAQAALGIAPGVVQLAELLEDLRLLCRTETTTVVGDLQEHAARILPGA